MKSTSEWLPSVKFASNLTIISVLLLPLVYLPGFGSYAAPRYFFFGTVALLLGLATARTWMQISSLPKLFFRSKLNWGIFIYLTAFVLAALFSMDKTSSFFSSFQRTDGAITIFFLTIFSLNLFTLLTIKGKPFLYKLLGSSVIGAVILSIFIMLSPDGIGNWFQGSRIGATTGNSSVAGTYILWNIFFGLIVAIMSQKRARIGWIISLVLMLGSPLFIKWHLENTAFGGIGMFGEARGAILGLVFGLIVAICVYMSLSIENKKKNLGKVGISLIVIVVVILAWQMALPTSKVHQGFAQLNSETRFIFWDISWKAFLEKPVLGWGPSAFNIPYQRFFEARMLLQPFGGELWADKAHNIFFESLATGGVVLTGSLIFLLMSVVLSIRRGKLLGNLHTLEASLLIGALAGWLLQAQFVFESLLSLTMLYLIASIAYSFNTPARQITPDNYRINNYTFGALAALAVILFFITVALPFKKARTMQITYNATLPGRIAMWENLKNGSRMGNGYDSVILFRNVFQAYDNNLEKINKGDPKIKKAVLDELEVIGTYLYDESQKQPQSPELAILGARILHLRMLLGNDFSGSDIERSKELTEKILDLSPTNPIVYGIAANQQLFSKHPEEAKKLLEEAVILEPRYAKIHEQILKFAKEIKDTAYYQSSLKRAQEFIPEFQEPKIKNPLW